MPIFRFKIPCTLKEQEQEYTPPTSHDLYMIKFTTMFALGIKVGKLFFFIISLSLIVNSNARPKLICIV
jgi:hypothetical protein